MIQFFKFLHKQSNLRAQGFALKMSSLKILAHAYFLRSFSYHKLMILVFLKTQLETTAVDFSRRRSWLAKFGTPGQISITKSCLIFQMVANDKANDSIHVKTSLKPRQPPKIGGKIHCRAFSFLMWFRERVNPSYVGFAIIVDRFLSIATIS